MAKSKKREAQMLSLVDPRFLSVVQSPANRSGFKIIRSEDGKLVKTGKPRRRVKAKRSDSDLLHITLPFGMTRQDAEAAMVNFGLVDDYTLNETEDGRFVLIRSDNPETPEGAIEIPLTNGMIATVAPTAFQRSEQDDGVPGVALVSLEFDDRFETAETVRSWLDERGIDPKNVEQVNGGFIVSLNDHDGPSKKVVVDEGVTGCVIRAAQNDVPKAVARSVLQQSYGNWGWGHLDFHAAMADPVYSDQSAMAFDAFREVLDNVVFFSGLDLDQRKSLIQNACSQYASFMSDLIDAMPRPVLEEARSASQRQESSMTTKTEEANKVEDQQIEETAAAEEAVRAEESSAESEAAVAAASGEGEEASRSDGEAEEAGQGDDAPVTRGELKSIISDAVAAALAAAGKPEEQGEEASRSEEGKAKDESDPMLVALRSLTEKVDGLQKTVDEFGDSAVTRSDDGDDGSAGDHGKGGDVFVGALGSLGGFRQ